MKLIFFFFRYANRQDADKAIETMNGTQLEDEILTVRYAETPQQKQRRTSVPVFFSSFFFISSHKNILLLIFIIYK